MTVQATARRAPRIRFRLPWPLSWLTWTRLVLLLLALGYWLFVHALERIDGNVVLASFFFPDLTAGQAELVTFSPWLRLVAEFFHPRVLRHFIPIIAGWQLAIQAAVSLMQVLYDCPDRKTAADFLKRQRRDRVGYMELPYVVLPHTLESAREESILLRVGGPVQVIIPNGYAAVTERNARFARVLPPGYHVLRRFEYLLGVVDLQPQSRSAQGATLLTREGIPVKADYGLTFQIDPGDTPSPLRPYPFRPEAVEKAAYAGSVGANGKVSTWADGPLGRVGGALGGWVSSHTLDELLAANPLPNADPSPDAHNLLIEAIIGAVWEKDRDQQLVVKDGIRPLRFHVSRLTPPEEISDQYTEVWLAAKNKEDRLAQADGKAELAQELETVRAQGQTLIIQAIVEGMRRAQEQAGSRISGYVLALCLVEALRQMFHLSARETQAVNADTAQLNQELASVSERLVELEANLKRPSVGFNPSTPD